MVVGEHNIPNDKIKCIMKKNISQIDNFHVRYIWVNCSSSSVLNRKQKNVSYNILYISVVCSETNACSYAKT